tara:strand:- start:2363 stop:3163 length:801 start_codon:yes stop_codon:yes gene_type:complete
MTKYKQITHDIAWHEVPEWMDAPRNKNNMIASKENGDAGWAGTNTLEEANELMTHGWQAGLDMVKQGLTYELADTGMDDAPQWEIGMAGQRPNIGAYCSGAPEHMMYMHDTSGQEPIIKMIVDVVCSCRIKGSAMINRGIALVGLIDYIESTGKRVHLIARWSTSDRGKQYTFNVTVKAPEEHMDMGRVAFAIGNPSFSRRIMFKFLENVSQVYIGGYGSPRTLTDVPTDTMYLRQMRSNSEWRTAQQAYDLVKEQWEEQVARAQV